MDKRRISQIKEQFDIVIHSDENAKVEFWYARELMALLGYERWENFNKTISRAMDSCETSGIEVSDHFREVTKMVTLGSGAHREIRDYMLTRYACYLIAQNGDPKKEEIAFAQSYFAVQTRKQELIEERIIAGEHVQNNLSVREMLGQRGIKPEELPPSEDIKKLERRVKSQEKKMAAQSGKLPENVIDGEGEIIF